MAKIERFFGQVIEMVILMMPSGACKNRPLLDFGAIRQGIRNDRSNSAFPFPALQAQTVSVQQSHGQFTVTPTGDNLAPRATRGQVRGMRFGREPSGTRLVEVIPVYRNARQIGSSQWASLCLPAPEKTKLLLLFERLAMLCKIALLLILLLASGCSSPVSRDFMCLFSHNPIAYRITEKELDRSTTLITVTRDNRTFMFRRDSIKICQLAEVVQPEQTQERE